MDDDIPPWFFLAVALLGAALLVWRFYSGASGEAGSLIFGIALVLLACLALSK